ncbi:MAG: TetR-like C-terminal domain-containing protein [Lachnospiraceae bacterium]|nr:TetR-like C-terminal domain-containing protein [Lachnospiraceae bacterium]
MKTEVLDRRVRKTRQQLRRCLATLLKEKKIQEITVREITEMADLNRGTFYLHYKDVFDLLEQVEHDLLREFNSTLQKYQASDVQQKPSLIFSDVFHCVKKNADMVQILLGENGDLNFVNQVKELVREKCLKDWVELFRQQKSKQFDAYYAFVVSGSIGLVTYWLESGMQETPEELAATAEGIMIDGIKVLFK